MALTCPPRPSTSPPPSATTSTQTRACCTGLRYTYSGLSAGTFTYSLFPRAGSAGGRTTEMRILRGDMGIRGIRDGVRVGWSGVARRWARGLTGAKGWALVADLGAGELRPRRRTLPRTRLSADMWLRTPWLEPAQGSWKGKWCVRRRLGEGSYLGARDPPLP